jgi:hypothetical protein
MEAEASERLQKYNEEKAQALQERQQAEALLAQAQSRKQAQEWAANLAREQRERALEAQAQAKLQEEKRRKAIKRFDQLRYIF